MARDRVRSEILKSIAFDMLEAGKELSEQEYGKLTNASVSLRAVNNHFGRWPRVVKLIKVNLPEVWEEIVTEKIVEPPPKPVAPKVRKVVKKPIPKVSVKKEIEDE